MIKDFTQFNSQLEANIPVKSMGLLDYIVDSYRSAVTMLQQAPLSYKDHYVELRLLSRDNDSGRIEDQTTDEQSSAATTFLVNTRIAVTQIRDDLRSLGQKFSEDMPNISALATELAQTLDDPLNALPL